VGGGEKGVTVTQTLFHGPVNLVARDPRRTFLEFGLYRNAGLSGDLLPSLAPVPGKPLHHLLEGVTFLDEVWAAAPFRAKGHLVRHVRATAAAWVSAGLLTETDAREVVSTAQDATYAP
jgi:uncharacterized protein